MVKSAHDTPVAPKRTEAHNRNGTDAYSDTDRPGVCGLSICNAARPTAIKLTISSVNSVMTRTGGNPSFGRTERHAATIGGTSVSDATAFDTVRACHACQTLPAQPKFT